MPLTKEERDSIEKNWKLRNLRKKLMQLQQTILEMKLDNEDYPLVQKLQQDLDRTVREMQELRS